MSFILDALRKSDQDRQRAAVPGVQTMHAPAAAAARRRLWPYALLITAVAGGAGVFVLWPKLQAPSSTMTQAPTPGAEKATTMKPPPSAPPVVASVKSVQTEAGGKSAENTPEPQDVAPLSPEVPQTPAPMKSAEEGQIAQEEPVEWIEISPPESAGSAPEIMETAGETSIPSVHGLPPSVQQQLPAINIAAQIYDSDPSARMAIINDRSLREGGMVAPGLVLEKIDEGGIILNFQGQRFHMDVFQSWSGH